MWACWPTWGFYDLNPADPSAPKSAEATVGIVGGVAASETPILADQLFPVLFSFLGVLALDTLDREGLPPLAVYWHWASLLMCQTWQMETELSTFTRSMITCMSPALQEQIAHHKGTYSAVSAEEDDEEEEVDAEAARNPLAARLTSQGRMRPLSGLLGDRELPEEWRPAGDFLDNTWVNLDSSEGAEKSRPLKIPQEEDAETVAGEGEEGEDGEDGEEEEEEVVSSLDTMIDFLIAFSPAILFIFVLPSVIFLYTGLDSELDHYAMVMKSLPRADCLKAAERLSTGAVSRRDKEAAIPSASSVSDARQAWIIVLGAAAVVAALTITALLVTRSTAGRLDALQEHLLSYTLLRAYVFDATRLVMTMITYRTLPTENTAFNGTYLGGQAADHFAQLKDRTWGALPVDPEHDSWRWGNDTALSEETSRALEETIELLDLLSLGYSEWGPAIGASEKADAIRFQDHCEVSQVQGSIATFFNCQSLERVFGFWVELVSAMVNEPEAYDFVSPDLFVLRVLMDSRVAYGFRDLLEALSDAYDGEYSSFQLFLQLILAASLVWMFLFFIIEIVVVGSVSDAVLTFRALLLRVNPVTFVANPTMLGLIYGSREIDTHVSSAAHAIFQTSQDALISLNAEGIIESLNPSATTIFGFTPEQMLGQSLKLLVNPETEGNATLFSTAHLMKTGQAGLVYEANVIGTKDDGTRVPLKLTLLGFASNGRSADSFAVMCKDQTEEVTQKTAVEEAKKQSENLLMQILPKDIIMRLNRGDKNISFTVASATIVFMDIEKFSSYSANLSPSELMKNLGDVFTAYDQLLPKFPLVLKIKLIGDDYMAAAGLFNPDIDPAKHANQVVQFAIECLDAIEELNEQLNASLEVRVGVNTGGPLIAGVLGTDKPLFDIIGDPINIAARLQSTDIPGLVQISQDTYDKIAGGPFNIEQRGEIELKGKGKRMTYVVHPREKA
jgi:PAS domain S-box-containing protein